MQGHGKSTACVQLYTGCLEWADPFIHLAFWLTEVGLLVLR